MGSNKYLYCKKQIQTHTYYKPYNITWLRLYILLLRFIYFLSHTLWNLVPRSSRLQWNFLLSSWCCLAIAYAFVLPYSLLITWVEFRWQSLFLMLAVNLSISTLLLGIKLWESGFLDSMGSLCHIFHNLCKM